ncbi:TPA: hypothetical protein HA234_01120 [Candidatus Woesearchaeota archaeon]|nr:hypothetical protein [Candidatus Woesearchaeota archaeon]HIG92780.1 hypothetical protein [Candidatus Woesearchaeota archaeon]
MGSKHIDCTMYGMSQGYASSARQAYSPLERLAQSYSSGQVAYSMHNSAPYNDGMFIPSPKAFSYSSSAHISAYKFNPSQYQFLTTQAEYHFQPDTFLKPGREGMFVGKAEEIRPYIEQAFELMFQEAFPADIKISVCNGEQFRAIAPHPGTIGLSINRRREGLLSEIFVLNDSLARVMLTIGHELGHVLTETLDHGPDEEAKAYAFSLAWMKVIQEQDIAGLGDSFVTENPAHNGLHDVGFAFVHHLLKQGRKAREIYRGLIERIFSVNQPGENLPLP